MNDELKPVGYAQIGLKELENRIKSKNWTEEMRQVLIIIEGERLYLTQEVPLMIMELFGGTGKIVYWAAQFIPEDPENLVNTISIKVNRWNDFSREYRTFKENSLARVLVFWTTLEKQEEHLRRDSTLGDIFKVQTLAWKIFTDLGEAGYNLPEFFRYEPSLGRVFPRDEVLKTE